MILMIIAVRSKIGPSILLWTKIDNIDLKLVESVSNQ